MDDIAIIDKYNVVCNSMILNLGVNPGFMQLAAIRHEIEYSPGNTEVIIILNTGNEDVEILTECRVSATKALVEAIDTIMGFNAVSYGW